MRNAYIIILAIVIILCGGIATFLATNNTSTGYWIWAGITSKDAPSNSELYVYQGLILSKNAQTSYERIGLYPYPINCKKLYLTYRVEGELPDVANIINIFQNSVAQWQRHGVAVAGIQLDFDSPTSKLLIYSNFLKSLRQQLPQPYIISITGLADWIMSADQQTIEYISSTVDEIVFQLYQGRASFPESNRYIKHLRHFPASFKIGILPNNQYISSVYLVALKFNPFFKGIVYFLQK